MTQPVPPNRVKPLADEVVGVFPDVVTLEAAIRELEKAGFRATQISLLGVPSEFVQSSLASLEDKPDVHRIALESLDGATNRNPVRVMAPEQSGDVEGFWAMAAVGGGLAAAIGARPSGGMLGASLATMLLSAVSGHHADAIAARLGNGEIVLWVSTPDAPAEQLALGIVQRCGGALVHAHPDAR